MLAPLRANVQRQAVSSVYQLPAPVGGLNARDPLAAMKPRDAVLLDNFFPEANSVELRRGHASHATGMATDVQSLLTYHKLNGVEKLFAASNGNIWDATAAGAASSSYSTSITVNKWQSVNFTNTAGTFLLAVNGTDTPLQYDGSSWATLSLTGVTSANLINVFAHKERLWWVEKNTLNLWYLASQAISGALTKLPLGAVFSRGGQIVAGGTLSTDSGDGMDDLLVAVTDNGEAVVYAGTNPASDFALIGRYDIGEPVGNRCLFKIGGDLMIITTLGVESMKQVILADRSQAEQRTITAKIQETFNAQVRSYNANFGWQGFVYPKGRMALVNVPMAAGSRQVQYVQNVITGAWSRFTNLNANCWGLLNDELYFGGNGGVAYKADTGYQDNGGQINAELKTAFTDCGRPGQNKMFKMLRPMLTNSGTAEVLAGVDVDFSDLAPTGTLSATAGNTGLWGSGLWGTAHWGGSLHVRKWLTVGKIGTLVSARLKVAANGISVKVNGFDVLYEPAKGTVL